MTLSEISREFDLIFNNAVGISAPEINTYEKSLFLTSAQEIIVKSLYDDLKRNNTVEGTERTRRRLQPLTTFATSLYDSDLNTTLAALKIGSNSYFFEILSTVWYILSEQVYVGTTEYNVIPVTNDEYSVQRNNPFKMPNSRKVWRRDIGNTGGHEKIVEIISTTQPTKYNYTYISKPSPIIIEDLSDGEYVGMGLTIEGISDSTECALDSELQRNIIVKAVELATLSYKENTLTNNVQSNQNNNF